jgi:hypothetical protein
VTTSEVLREAAAVLMRQGWVQESYGSMSGPVCLVSGLAAAGKCEWLTSLEGPAEEAAQALRRWLGGEGDSFLEQWNDAPERTAEDVILALKQCAYDLENS